MYKCWGQLHSRNDADGAAAARAPRRRLWYYLRTPLDNLGALDLTLDRGDLDRLSVLRPAGTRYPDMSWTERDTAPLAG